MGVERKKVMAIFGTRPEANKMAPVVGALSRLEPYFDVKVAVTAQHREMLDQMLALFSITPDYDLDIMRHGQTLEGIVSLALKGLSEVLDIERPDLVLVHGDTHTTFVGALASFYKQIPVGHVEAGLRTDSKYSPFPEEMNRRLTGKIADIHFAPTAKNRAALLREGVPAESVFVTGNTAVDALRDIAARPPMPITDPLINAVDFDGRRVILVTAHRRENWGEPMRRIFEAFRRIVQSHDDVEILYCIHKNPAIRAVAEEMLGALDRVTLVEPPDYGVFVQLMQRSYLILTDSGGIQEEAPALGKPTLVLRDNTERPEAVEAGVVLLVGSDTSLIADTTSRLLADPQAYSRMAQARNPFGDGRAAERISQAIMYHFGFVSDRPGDLFV